MPPTTDFPGVTERRGASAAAAAASAAVVAGELSSVDESEPEGSDFGMGTTGDESEEDGDKDMDDGMMGGPAAAGTVYTETTGRAPDDCELVARGTKTKDPRWHWARNPLAATELIQAGAFVRVRVRVCACACVRACAFVYVYGVRACERA